MFFTKLKFYILLVFIAISGIIIGCSDKMFYLSQLHAALTPLYDSDL